MKNKKAMILFVSMVLFFVFLFIIFQQKTLKIKNEGVIVEYGQQVSREVSNYLDLDKVDVDTKNDILSKAKLDMNIENETGKEYPGLGEYKATITYDKDKIAFTIIIRDTTAPVFKDFKNTIETAKDIKADYTQLYAAEDLGQVIMTCDDTNVKYDVVGEYKAIVKATDTSKNEATKEITVKVIETSIKLDKETSSLYVKETLILNTTIAGKKQKATFKSSNEKIASVDKDGKVTAKSSGGALITASANGEEVVCKVTVKETPKGSSTITKKDSNGNNVTVVTPPNNNVSSGGKIANSDYVKVKSYIPNIFVNLKYSTNDNFTKQKIYNFNEAYLRYGTVKKLKKVQEELNQEGYSLLIWDAYRPFSAQKKLWEVVGDPRYVSNPNKGPRNHNLGGTVDITIVKSNGKKISVPTEFDDFSKRADRDYSDIADQEAVVNANLLQRTMYKYGFTGYKNEWWDYRDSTVYDYIDFKPK